MFWTRSEVRSSRAFLSRRGRQWAWTWLSAATVMLALLAAVVRAQTGGDLDPTFGSGGRAIVDLGATGFEIARATIVQPDGKIVVAGESVGQFAVARFNTDGTLDSGFGNGGITTAGFGFAAEPKALFLDFDGKIVVAGQGFFGGSSLPSTLFVRRRFEADGRIDVTFGSDGIEASLLATGFEDPPTLAVRFRITAVARTQDGGFVVGGTKEVLNGQSSVTSALAARFLPFASTGLVLDSGFGDGGIVTTSVGQRHDVAAVLVQPDDGKLLLVGRATVAGNQNVALLRYTIDGDLDPAFGDGGAVFTDINGADTALAALLQSSGNILVAGQAGDDLALVRYLPDGRRDNSFSGDGKVATDVKGGVDRAAALALQPDERIVVAGSTRRPGQTVSDFLVARYNPDGLLDTTFGQGGVVVTDLRGSDDALAVALQQDGKIVAAGGADQNDQADFAVARYEPGTQADLTLEKSVSATSVNVGETFTYTLRVRNHGPDEAENVVVRDQLPAGLVFVSCAAPAGTCGTDGGVRTVSFAAIGVGQTRTATLTVSLGATVPDGTTISNTASVVSDAVDPDITSNAATVAIAARNVPHTLRLFLHGADVPGTAGGFTMNAVPAPAQAIRLNLRNAPTWFSDPALTGTVGAGATFRVIRPCTLGVSLAATYRLARTDLAGGSEQILGQTQRLLGLCVGQEVISIPVPTPVTFANQRLRLTISSPVSLNVDLQLGEGTFFEVTNFAGLP